MVLGILIIAVPVLPVWVYVKVLVGFGTNDPMTFWIAQVSAIEFNVPAVPELTVPDSSKIGLFITADDIITGVPA
jgi:hypothetical protein